MHWECNKSKTQHCFSNCYTKHPTMKLVQRPQMVEQSFQGFRSGSDLQTSMNENVKHREEAECDVAEVRWKIRRFYKQCFTKKSTAQLILAFTCQKKNNTNNQQIFLHNQAVKNRNDRSFRYPFSRN